MNEYKCNCCKKGYKYLEINQTNLGLLCNECSGILRKKVNESDKPISYYRDMLNNNENNLIGRL